ncbi:hypothetical protein B0H16DRAFT_1708935 [Mycena metata]|uniref:Uncharacterized protein n=1 Tax=Mycena metata TaxID=1033252 RepID=A0AAD7KJ12_9AGAR|nr:hypothetical protein B0H16DRAFT_1708935 [Mycena metata]
MDARVYRAFSQIARDENAFLQAQITLYTERLNAEYPSYTRQIRYQTQIRKLRNRTNERIERRFVAVLDHYGHASDQGPYYDPTHIY